MLIAPVLSAVKAYNADRIALFSGEALSAGDLSGVCDFIISANPKAFLPESSITVLVEAKKQDLYGGIPHPTIFYYPELKRVLGVFKWIIDQFSTVLPPKK